MRLSCYLILFYALAFNPGRAETPAYYESTLKEADIPSTTEGAAAFLAALSEGGPRDAEVIQRVRDLGSPDFHARETATAELMRISTFPAELVRRASRGDNKEAAWRARRLLDARLPDTRNLLFAVLKTVQAKEFKGLAAPILSVVPLCDQRHLFEAGQFALSATVLPGDQALLLDALKHEEAPVRVAALHGLGAILDGAVPEALMQSLQDPETAVVLAASLVLANQADPRCVPHLVALLDADSPVTRGDSVMALRRISGQHYQFAAYGSRDNRAAALARWKAWADSPAAGELKPLAQEAKKNPGFLGGSTVIAMCNEHRVSAFDANGKEIWNYPCRFPYDVKPMPNGNLLIPVRNSSKVIEVNAAKEVVWEVTQQLACHANPLSTGNLLLCGERSKQVLEINREKEIVWSHEGSDIINAAFRLEDGNTLLKSNYKIEIIHPDGTPAWKHIMKGHYIYSVQPLRSGNLLVCLENRVFELTPDHQEVQELKLPGKVFNAWRLPDGNTLITGARYYAELTPDSEVLYKRAIESSWAKISK